MRKRSAPAPRPSRKRPPVRSASEVAIIAISATFMDTGLKTPTPSSMWLVVFAAAPTRTAAECQNKSLETQTWSKPDSSASAARRAKRSGGRSLLKRTLNRGLIGG